MNRFLRASFSLAIVGGSVLALAAAQAASVDARPSWTCSDTTLANDNSYALELFEATATSATKIEVFHSGFIGTRKVATLNFCTIQAPPAGTADGATTVDCHNGAWSGSQRAVVSLGGFIPYSGSALFLAGNPGAEEEVTNLSCLKTRD